MMATGSMVVLTTGLLSPRSLSWLPNCTSEGITFIGLRSCTRGARYAHPRQSSLSGHVSLAQDGTVEAWQELVESGHVAAKEQEPAKALAKYRAAHVALQTAGLQGTANEASLMGNIGAMQAELGKFPAA